MSGKKAQRRQNGRKRRSSTHNPPLHRLVREINAAGQLVIWVGAGLSIGCGLPDWRTLVERVVRRALRAKPLLAERLLNDDLLVAVRHARCEAGSQFNRMVRECLYSDREEISASVKALVHCGVRRICTFNYDDLIEEAFATAGKNLEVIAPGTERRSLLRATRIYHPHGIVPRLVDSNEEIDAAKIILSEDDYHAEFSDPYSWTNILLLSLLSQFTVLFVGMSMRDPAVRRALSIVRARGFSQQHFAILRDPTGNRAAPTDAERTERELLERDLRGLSVTPWFVARHEHIARILERISVHS